MIWQRKLPTFTTPDCGSYGVSSTGVVDEARGRLYVAAADVPGWPVQLPIDTATGYVWGGLTLAGSSLYVPVASYCDEPDPATGAYPTGGLTAIDVDTASIGASFVVSGPDTLGGIWGYGGTSVDPLTGDLWTATGSSEPLGGASETQGYTEAVIELYPSLHVVGWNRPDGIPSETTDTDFGSTPTLFQPQGCPPLAAAYNKNGQLYVWRRDDVGAGSIWTVKIGPDDLDTPFIGEPSWSSDEQMLYVANARVYDTTAPDGVARYDAAVASSSAPAAASRTLPPGSPTRARGRNRRRWWSATPSSSRAATRAASPCSTRRPGPSCTCSSSRKRSTRRRSWPGTRWWSGTPRGRCSRSPRRRRACRPARRARAVSGPAAGVAPASRRTR